MGILTQKPQKEEKNKTLSAKLTDILFELREIRPDTASSRYHSISDELRHICSSLERAIGYAYVEEVSRMRNGGDGK